jgi:hypothetical protein
MAGAAAAQARGRTGRPRRLLCVPRTCSNGLARTPGVSASQAFLRRSGSPAGAHTVILAIVGLNGLQVPSVPLLWTEDQVNELQGEGFTLW